MRDFKISNFSDFVNEKYVDTSLSDVVQRFYLLVRKPFPTDAKSPLGKMISSVRNTIFDQIPVSDSNYRQLPILPGVPVLNFTEDSDVVKNLVEEKLIDKNCLYNRPEQSDIVSDKVMFHRAFESFDFVPRTMFDLESAKSLQFPIIAKPAKGKSAKGIVKFSTSEEMTSSTDKFDIFSEMIDISREFRCFCFRDMILSIDERIKVEGAEDFLSNAEATTDFYYKALEPETYERISPLNVVLQNCRKVVDLDFFSVDFAETGAGEIRVIEMNSRTGMGVNKMVDLYVAVYEDFYKAKVPVGVKTKVDLLSSEWDETYAREKSVSECTTVAGIVDDDLFLFKNRDRSYTPDNRVIREKFKGTEIVYYTDQTGWIEGMNEHGVGFVFSQLSAIHRPGYKPAWFVSDEPKNPSKFDRFAEGVKKILTAKNVDEAIDLLIASKKSGSFLIGDKKDLYEIEIFKGENKKRKLKFDEKSVYVKSNHGSLFPEAGHQPKGDSIKRASSSIRKHQAETQLVGLRSLEEIPGRMKFQAFDSNSSLNVFRTDVEEHTISQCMMNLSKLEFFFFHDDHTADTVKIEDSVKEPKVKVVVSRT